MTAGDAAVIVLVSLPHAAAIAGFVWPSRAVTVSLISAATLMAAALVAMHAVAGHGAWRHDVGGWEAPLGIGWTIDGVACALLLLTAAVGLAGSIHHAAARVRPSTAAHDPRYFWPLWLFLWGGLNALFVSADLFNIFVTLEFVTVASVGLIALSGRLAQAAAWRYLLATLFGSSLYLLGVALIYGRVAALDLPFLAQALPADLVGMTAASLVTIGLLLKGAVFPLHFWLPSAHARALPPVSAILSGVVVAAAFYLLARAWLGPFRELLTPAAGTALGLLGAGAVLWGGLLALLQRHLKRMIAYSTVSQLGFCMLLFPLAAAGAAQLAWTGAMVVLLAHGLSKAACFLAAGVIVRHHRSGRVDALGGCQQGIGLAWFAFALAAASLVGLPPTGGFVGKWWLAQAAINSGAYPWLALLVAGTLLTAAYLWRVLEAAIRTGPPDEARRPAAIAAHREGAPATPSDRGMMIAALGLALGAVAVGAAAPTLAPVLSSAIGVTW